MWTTANRPSYKCHNLRYPSDLTDEKWRQIVPLIPPKHGGRKRKGVDGIMFAASDISGRT